MYLIGKRQLLTYETQHVSYQLLTYETQMYLIGQLLTYKRDTTCILSGEDNC